MPILGGRCQNSGQEGATEQSILPIVRNLRHVLTCFAGLTGAEQWPEYPLIADSGIAQSRLSVARLKISNVNVSYEYPDFRNHL